MLCMFAVYSYGMMFLRVSCGSTELKNGDRDISNRTHSGRPHTPNKEILKGIRELDLRQSTRGWRQNINVSCSDVHQYSRAN